jgi:hypothetical protein
MGGLILTEQGLTNHSPLQLVKQYQRVLERTRKVEIRELLKTDESKTLQKAMLLLIGAVEKVLPGLLPEGSNEPVISRAKVMAKRFIAVVGPSGDVTPRHADGTHDPLALNVCHFLPLAWLETTTTLRSHFLFLDGRCANVADGSMVSMCSTNHRTEGWLMVQLNHAMIKHLMGQGSLAGFSRGFYSYGPHTLPLLRACMHGL